MGKQKIEKTKQERLSEGIYLLNQVKEAGIKENTLSYQELKSRITEWITTGGSWEDRMEFPEYGRVADILLKIKK